ncbi:8-amino-7-oxononanoate synthase [Flavobacterium sp. MK4S-17]|uniref:aminotransferase class I/II-fold pyridoxal phosphate-dependent enzyme n=1 Tax=Flavobacterium sp. MK4S-17 TaxID=2543737 RepID=UPI001356C7A2|nr:8-amino-7-oxononanoate synthase [Flavobacterium sp. MK4S-17]
MKAFPAYLEYKLNQRKQDGSFRMLTHKSKEVDFSSNDYLGLSASKEIYEAAHKMLLQKNGIANGATGSRLISGNHILYNDAEEMIAAFHNAESALIFNSGYDANIGFFSSVPQKGDIVLYDEYIHASIRDGIRLSNARAYKFSHNSIDGLKLLLKKFKDSATEIYIVTESVFSMDGDSPDFYSIAKLSAEYNCRLVIDEAHAIGVFGSTGEGLAQQVPVFARIVTFGKALGCHGAAVLGSSILKQYLVNFARSFIYTTALPPHAVATILCAYSCIKGNNTERQQLRDIISFFTEEILRMGLNTIFITSSSAIHCAVLPGNKKVKKIALALQDSGFSVKSILSPTVPAGQERLRFCLHSYNTKQEVTNVLTFLNSLLVP